MDDDTEKKLEQSYRATWLCSGCGRRHPMTVGTCDPCMDAALQTDDEKLRQLGAYDDSDSGYEPVGLHLLNRDPLR